MSDRTRISASVSATTKEQLERFVESRGLKKDAVIEQALLFFMRARRELPDEALIPTEIVLDAEAFDRVVRLLNAPPRRRHCGISCVATPLEIRPLRRHDASASFPSKA